MDKTAVIDLLKTNFALDPQNAKVLVVGLGKTGMSVARYLQNMGFKFAIIDSRDKPPLIDEFIEQMPDTPVFTGGFDDDAFKVATHLVVSPGLSLNEKVICKAIANGSKIVSDIDLFACSVNAPIIAITGSNGKSTVTTMLGEMAQAAGKCVAVGGNLGVPALDLLFTDLYHKGNVVHGNEADLYVLELSSFQLERTSALNAAAATVLNVSADHLDRHTDVSEYAEEKRRIFKGNGVMVLNADDPIVNNMQEAGRRVLTFSIKKPADFHLAYKEGIDECANTDDCMDAGGRATHGAVAEYLTHIQNCLMPLADLPLEGRHNAANALAALALGVAVGLDETAMC
ncbi:MAG: UDP-N-acetylmuramoyl-L-alanine--D-glutamate ligase, partial [Methylobacter sp.]